MHSRTLMKKSAISELPGSPVVGTSPSNAGSEVSFPGWGAKIPHALNQKTKMWKTRSNIVTNSIKWKWSRSVVSDSATPWTTAYQAPPSTGFSKQEYWSGLPFPSPGDLPNPGIEPGFPAFQADALTSEPPGKPHPKKKKIIKKEFCLKTDFWLKNIEKIAAKQFNCKQFNCGWLVSSRKIGLQSRIAPPKSSTYFISSLL